MHDVRNLGINISPWLILPLVYLVWLTLLMAFKKFLFKAIKRISTKTKTHLDDLFIQSADFPITLLIFTSGALVVERIMPALTHEALTGSVLIIFKAVTIVAVILFADKFLSALLKEYAGKIDVLKTSGGVVRGFVRVTVIGLGVLILLDSFGICRL